MEIAMNWEKSICLIMLASLSVMVMAGCTKPGESTPSTGKQTSHPEGWTEETHSNNVDPNYKIVFPQNKVNQIKITITPEDWNAMQANMTELLGTRGTSPRGGQPEAPGVRPDRRGVIPDGAPQDGGVAPRVPGIPGWIDMIPENPMWVPATIEFNGLTWTNVGIRYKGNSSLMSGWNSGTLKLPLKLDFDEFEDEYPEIENQRFYGFKQLSLSNAFSDSTYMRDTIAADLLAEAGLVAAETAYYEVILDYGEGPVNLGLYVAVEVIDDTVIDRFFGDDSGNIYEGDGPGVSLAEGTFNQIQTSFLKENNEQDADWSDIEALYNVLHSESRTSDAEEWRESLESIFNVNAFLKWLAISAIIEHWDTYGSMTHNFYLYHDPDTGLLNWISWDHNQVLAGGVPGGMRIPGGGMGRNMSLGMEEVGQNWPLIRYLLDDPVYHERYIDYVEATVNGVFNPDKIKQRCQELAKLMAPYATKNSTEAAFESSVQELINHVNERYQAATAFLAAEGR
jgi:spore coat protein CotH